MLAQALRIGINLNSPLTWFIIAVALIVLALTVSTRRASTSKRGDRSRLPLAPTMSVTRARYTDEWSAAQALFVDDPHAGYARARAIVTSVVRDRGVALQSSEPLALRYRSACEHVPHADASTDDLRQAFILLRGVFDALLADDPERVRLWNT